MKKFEYAKVPGTRLMKDKSIDMKVLNELGSDGWELVTFTWVNDKLAFAYFKREVQGRFSVILADGTKVYPNVLNTDKKSHRLSPLNSKTNL